MSRSYSELIDYLFWRSHKTGAPMSGNFELTARCNLDCKMCYIHKKANDGAVRKEELTAKQWISIATEAQKKGMLLLLLTGGEPFLRPDFQEIYTACQKLGLLISINTNGTMITDEMIEFLRKNPPLRMNITLYGASRETYEALCGDPGAYERVFSTVKKLKKAGIRVKLNYSATPENRKDASKIYEFAKQEELLIQTASYMFPPVRACENGACTIERMTPRESADVRWEYDQYRYSVEELKTRVRLMMEGKDLQDDDCECQELPTERIRCRAGATTFWVTYKGEMRPCGMMQVPSISLLDFGFEAAWGMIRKEREKIMVPAKCTACKWKKVCEQCPATCYAENGTFEKEPEYLCEKTKAYLRSAAEWLTLLS